MFAYDKYPKEICRKYQILIVSNLLEGSLNHINILGKWIEKITHRIILDNDEVGMFLYVYEAYKDFSFAPTFCATILTWSLCEPFRSSRKMIIKKDN